MVLDSNRVIWTAPDGKSFVLKTLESGFSQKHIGEVKENPRTSVSTSTSSKGKKKGSTSTSVSTSSATKRVGDSNDTFTDMGIGGRDISLDCYFIGEKHFVEAEAFRQALCQVGKSKLQLAYGDEFTVNVLNFELKNSLVERVNSTIITVNWHETSPSTYPKSETSKQNEIKSKVSETKENIAETVQATANAIVSPTQRTTFAANFQGVLTKVSTALDTANNITLNSIMTDIMSQNVMLNARTITSQLGTIFSKSAMLVNKVNNAGGGFVISSNYSSLFGGWTALLSSLKTPSLLSSSGDNYTAEQINELKLNDSIASSAIISVAESLLSAEFETRKEAVEAAKNLVALESDWTEFVDEQQTKISDLDDAYIRDGSVGDIVSMSANEILERSYKLKVEQTITLSENKTPIELAYEYYKDDFRNDPDGILEYLIRTNDLKDERFFLVPQGSEVKIYV